MRLCLWGAFVNGKKRGKKGGGAERDLPEGRFILSVRARPRMVRLCILSVKRRKRGVFPPGMPQHRVFFRRKRGKRRFSFAAVCFRTPRCFLFLPPAPYGRPVLKRVFFRRKGVRRGLREGISPVFSAGETGMVNEKRPPEYPTAGNTPEGAAELTSRCRTFRRKRRTRGTCRRTCPC